MFNLLIEVATVASIITASPQQIKDWCSSADSCLQRGDLTSAAEYYQRCIDATQCGAPLYFLTVPHYRIANLYHELGNLEDAEKYVNLAIDLCRPSKNETAMAMRYAEASQICIEMNRPEKALALSEDALRWARSFRSENPLLMGRLTAQLGDCKVALGDLEAADSVYQKALEACQHGLLAPEIFRGMARVAELRGDSEGACRNYIQMYDAAATLKADSTVVSQASMFEAAEAIARLTKDSDLVMNQQYVAIADSLSFSPMIKRLANRIAKMGIEFPTKELTMQNEIDRQQRRLMIALHIILCIFILLVIGLFIIIRLQRRLSKSLEERNTTLEKLNQEKDRLIELAKVGVDKGTKAEMTRIEKALPEQTHSNLTKREIEIIRLCCDGLMNKEIAAKLNLSLRTVETHKSHILKKLGLGTSIELINYAHRVGIVK